MEAKLIKNISAQVYRQFPDFSGVQPKVRLQPAPASGRAEIQTYLLTFQMKANLGDGKTLNRLVRVVANEQGKIIKISTSR